MFSYNVNAAHSAKNRREASDFKDTFFFKLPSQQSPLMVINKMTHLWVSFVFIFLHDQALFCLPGQLRNKFHAYWTGISF